MAFDETIWGFTGPRVGMSTKQKRTFRDILITFSPKELHLGDCKGADTQAYHITKLNSPDTRLIGHPPTIGRYRSFLEYDEDRPKKPYLRRNRSIIEESGLLTATPIGLEIQRSGTWSTIRYGREKGIKIILICRDGKIKDEQSRTIGSISR